MIQVCGERVLSENRMKRKRLSDQKKTRSKRRKGMEAKFIVLPKRDFNYKLKLV